MLVMTLLDLPAFSSVAKLLREAALKLRTDDSAITIAAPLNEEGVFASALLEGALLDAGIPYQRRLRENPQPSKGPCIVIGEETVSQLSAITTNPLCIHLSGGPEVGGRRYRRRIQTRVAACSAGLLATAATGPPKWPPRSHDVVGMGERACEACR